MVRDVTAAAPDRPVVAAGAVLWRMRDAALEICLIHRPRYDDWTLPKGKVEDGEHVLATAIREVEEETGHRVHLGRPLPAQRYLVRDRPKVVRYWTAHAAVGTPHWQPTREVDHVAFLPVGDAVGRLSYPHDAETVSALVDGPLQTTPLVLLRHTESVSRSDWSNPDQSRPLSARGTTDAHRLVAPLSAFGRLRVVSSDAVRCADSIRPYATSHGLTVELEPALSEDSSGTAPVARLVQELLAADAPALLCSHRPVLPSLLETATAQGRSPVPTDPLPPGGFHVLHHRGGVVVDIETHAI